MTDEKAGPSKSAAGIAASLPVLFSLASCCVLPIAVTGEADAARAEMLVQEMGIWFYVVTGVGALSALACAVLMLLAARGKRIPAALVLFFAALPWLAGLAGTASSIALATEAVQFADASSRATLLARGIAEGSTAKLMGSWIGGSLLSAVGLGWAFASLGQRAPERRGIGALLAIAATLPVLGLIAFAFLGAGPNALVLVLPGLALVVGAGMAAAGAGADAPRYRSAAMAAAAPLALGLSFVATTIALHTASMVEMFEALATVGSSSRLEVLAGAANELAPVQLVATWGGLAMLLSVAAVGIWSAVRGKVSGGRIAGAIIAVLVAASLPAADSLVTQRAGDAIAEMSAAPWEGAEGFAPVAMTPTDDWGEPDALLLSDGRMQRVGDTGPSERSALLSDLVRPEREPSVALAIDASTPPATLRRLLGELREARAGSLHLVGTSEDSLSPAQWESIRRNAPMLALVGEPPAGVTVRLGPQVVPPGRLPGPSALHATIGSEPATELRDAAGDRPPTSLSDRLDPMAGERPEPGTEAYLFVGEDATPSAVAQTAARAAVLGFEPVLLEATEEPETMLRGLLRQDPGEGETAGLGALGSDAGVGSAGLLGTIGGIGGTAGSGRRQPPGTTSSAGRPVVRGSLPREVIQRVVRQHTSEVRFCYERVLARDPTLAGTVTVRFVITPEGEVADADVQESTLDSGTVERCLTQAVRRWRFPTQNRGGVVVVSYPFQFQSS